MATSFRFAIETPKALSAVGRAGSDPVRLEVIQSEGVYLATWGWRLGWGYTPEEAVENLYGNVRRSLEERARAAVREAVSLNLDAWEKMREANRAAAAAREFPAAPPGDQYPRDLNSSSRSVPGSTF